MSFINYIAEAATTTEASGDVFSALGIQLDLLIFQIIAFLILVVLLAKFVYPWLMKQVDERQANIEAATKAAIKAQESAAESQTQVAELLAQARKEADSILSNAKLESSELLSASETKARTTAEKIAEEAQANIEKSIETAKRELHDETLELIAFATEKVIHKKLDKKADAELIASALKESE
ncbi:MAG: F0F1 ATP synthase subunit B [Patescibacteria group bacterium]